jgi:hypothetical protein
VDFVVKENIEKFKNENWEFFQMDVSHNPLTQSYDLIMHRDVILHLSDNQIMCALNNFSKSGSKYLLVTNYNRTKQNPVEGGGFQIGEGGWRMINIHLAPFNVPQSLVLETYEEPQFERELELLKLPLPLYNVEC